MGIARTQEELEVAARRISYIKGVNQVVSYVKIKGATPNDPDQIYENTQIVTQQDISDARAEAELAGSAY